MGHPTHKLIIWALLQIYLYFGFIWQICGWVLIFEHYIDGRCRNHSESDINVENLVFQYVRNGFRIRDYAFNVLLLWKNAQIEFRYQRSDYWLEEFDDSVWKILIVWNQDVFSPAASRTPFDQIQWCSISDTNAVDSAVFRVFSYHLYDSLCVGNSPICQNEHVPRISVFCFFCQYAL